MTTIDTSLNRRHLLQGAAATAGAVALASIAPRTVQAAEGAKLQKGQTVLFQGDSITPAGHSLMGQAWRKATGV